MSGKFNKLKQERRQLMTRFVLVIVFLGMYFLRYPAETEYLDTPAFQQLLDGLERDGIEREKAVAFITNERVIWYPKIAEKFQAGRTMEKSSTYNPYLKFLEPDAIKKGRQFYNRNQAIFESVEIRFKIPAGILVGLLHIESKLGDNTGRYQAFGVLLSILRYSPDKNRKDWACKEIRAFLKADLPLFFTRSSYAGAFGIPQFLPSSYLTYGIDGNSDGVIDLNESADAIFSAANYLTKNGWAEIQTQSLYHYNNSQKFVSCIVEYAKKLEQEQ